MLKCCLRKEAVSLLLRTKKWKKAKCMLSPENQENKFTLPPNIQLKSNSLAADKKRSNNSHTSATISVVAFCE